MEGGIGVNEPRGGQKVAVLRLHVDLHCKTAGFYQLFGDVSIFCIVVSKKDKFLTCHYFYFYDIH